MMPDLAGATLPDCLLEMFLSVSIANRVETKMKYPDIMPACDIGAAIKSVHTKVDLHSCCKAEATHFSILGLKGCTGYGWPRVTDMDAFWD